MAIRAGQLVLTHNGTLLLERVQTANGTLNIPTEIIRELGNPRSVATVRDTPDLSYAVQSFDATTYLESWLTGTTITGATGADLVNIKPRNLITQLRSGNGTTAGDDNIVGSFIAPAVLAERVSYRFAVQENSTIDVSLRGDAQFISPGPAYLQSVAGSGVAAQAIILAQDAGAYIDSAGTFRALAVVVGGRRLTPGVDYTETVTGTGDFRAVTVTLAGIVPVTETIEVLYFSDDPRAVASADFTPDSNLDPAALRGRSVQVYVGGYDPLDIPGSQVNRWTGVRAATAEWAITVESDFELGNAFAYDRAATDTPEVSGSITIRPIDVAAFLTRMRQITGAGANIAIGADSAVPLELDIVLKAQSGATIKRLHIPDARISVPGVNGQVAQKVDFELSYTADTGSLQVFAA